MSHPPAPHGGQPPQYGGGPPRQGGRTPRQGARTPKDGVPPPHAFQPYQSGSTFGGPPPPRRRTGTIVAVATALAVVVVVVGITGFVSPGFLHAGGERTNDQRAAADTEKSGDFLDSLIEAANDKDVNELRGLICAEPGRNVKPAITYVGSTERFKLRHSKLVSDAKLDATVDITFEDKRTSKFDFIAIKQAQGWCWYEVIAIKPAAGSTPTPDPQTGKGLEFAKHVLEVFGAGDAARAKGLLCKDSTTQGEIDELVRRSPKLKVDTKKAESQAEYIGVDLQGTVDGQPIGAGRLSGFLQDGGWCLYTIYVFTY